MKKLKVTCAGEKKSREEFAPSREWRCNVISAGRVEAPRRHTKRRRSQPFTRVEPRRRLLSAMLIHNLSQERRFLRIRLVDLLATLFRFPLGLDGDVDAAPQERWLFELLKVARS